MDGTRTFKDGDKWCTMTGEDLQSGIATFGDTKKESIEKFEELVVDVYEPIWKKTVCVYDKSNKKLKQLEEPVLYGGCTSKKVLYTKTPNFQNKVDLPKPIYESWLGMEVRDEKEIIGLIEKELER